MKINVLLPIKFDRPFTYLSDVSYKPENYTNLFRGDTTNLINNVVEYYYLVNIKNSSLPLVLKPNQTGNVTEELKINNENYFITLAENSIIDGKGSVVIVNKRKSTRLCCCTKVVPLRTIKMIHAICIGIVDDGPF